MQCLVVALGKGKTEEKKEEGRSKKEERRRKEKERRRKKEQARRKKNEDKRARPILIHPNSRSPAPGGKYW